MREEAASFSGVAAEYERGRPEYPVEAVEWIASAAGLGPGTVVVDLAAGTGKLTRRLVPSGARVIAVEPLEAMRRQLASLLPQVEAVAGTAEETGLPAAVATAVTVGQAFHWFSTPEALEEISRVLVPGGHLALVWNEPDDARPLQAELAQLLAPHREGSPSERSGAWREVMERSNLFEQVAERSFPFVQVLDAEGLVDRVTSVSYIAKLPDDERAGLLARVRELAGDGSVDLGYDCEVYLFRKRRGSPGPLTARNPRGP